MKEREFDFVVGWQTTVAGFGGDFCACALSRSCGSVRCAFGCDHVGNRDIELDQAFDCCAAT
jgi:hypothetical protein